LLSSKHKIGDYNFWANNLPLLMMTKHMSYLNKNLGKSFVKTPPQVMLAIKYKISTSYMIKALYKSMIKQIPINTHKYFSPFLSSIKKGKQKQPKIKIYVDFIRRKTHESTIQTFKSPQMKENLLKSSGLVKISASKNQLKHNQFQYHLSHSDL